MDIYEHLTYMETGERKRACGNWVALLVKRYLYLSNAASRVFNGITCLIRLVESATSTLFVTFEESAC